MTPRKILGSVLVLGLAGVGLYAAPCLSGPCGDEPSVAASDEADAPCDTPCDPPCDTDKAKALAAAGDEEPCPFAEKATAETALAAVEEDEPCPHAVREQGSEPQLAAQVEVKSEAPEVAPVVDGEPQT